MPADLLVYTLSEWEAMMQDATPFARRLAAETLWVWARTEAVPNRAARS